MFFGTMRLKLFHGKTWNSTKMSKNFWMPQIFWIIERFLTKNRHRETKKFDKIVIPFIQRLFDTRTFLKHKGPPTKLFGTVRQKRSTKSWYNYYPKNFETRIILKHRRVPPRCFSAICDKKTSTEKRETPFFLTINFFRTRNFLNDKSVHPRSLPVLWD